MPWALPLLLSLCHFTVPAVAGDEGSKPAWLDQRYDNLPQKTTKELRLLRNEIFARHGKMFLSPDLVDYFSHQSWYTPDDQFSDERLSAIELSTVKRILRVERALSKSSSPRALPEEDEDKYPSDNFRRMANLQKIQRNQGIPNRIGNLILGQRLPDKLEGVDTFLARPGQFQYTLNQSSTVESISFEFAEYNEGQENSFLKLFEWVIGSKPRRQNDAWVWRNQKYLARFVSQDCGGLSICYSIYIQSADPTLPGGQQDGFDKFMDAFIGSSKKGSAAEVVRFVHFPFFDSCGINCEGPLACETKEDFLSKFQKIAPYILMDRRPKPFFMWPDTYRVYLGYKPIDISKIDGEWKIMGFVYTE